MENKIGYVKAISQQNNAVQIEHNGMVKWLPLGAAIKINFVKKGQVEFNTIVEGDEEFVSFIKVIKNKPLENFDSEPRQVRPNDAFKSGSEIDQQVMNRMCALKYAATVFEGTAKTEECILFTKAIHKFLQDGTW